MEIKRAKHMGFCFGVVRVLKLAREAIEQARGKAVYSLGPLIHNWEALKYENLNLPVVEDLSNVPDGSTLVVRAHGLSPTLMEEAAGKHLAIVDGTCPLVTKVQKLARGLKDEGYQVVIVGKQIHPEIIGVMGHLDGDGTVVERPEEVPSISLMKRMGIVTQTTTIFSKFQEMTGALLSKAKEWKIHNTICFETVDRQVATQEVARETGCVVVVGGKHSANTRHLAEICKMEGAEVYHVEDAKELIPEWFSGMEKVGIAAGASTHPQSIKEVEDTLRSFRELTLSPRASS
ncbi:MAG: 4-hydroxy-3-methylbut-2-enyl diphosphate reductase [Armatimonadetes bacterium]|nr:4-hydroxy-3-methylbut-2-enyl diphosphate reductase [Armatimonadota bacterium]